MSWKEKLDDYLGQGTPVPEAYRENLLTPGVGTTGQVNRQTGGGFQIKPDGVIEMMASGSCGIRLNPETGRILLMGHEIVVSGEFRQAKELSPINEGVKELREEDERRTFL